MNLNYYKHKKWDTKDIDAMKNFVKTNENMLLSTLYKNIYNGKIIFRKKSKFFTQMGKILKRPSSNCKSKFQKYEKEIYIDFLGVPEIHYLLLKHIRGKKMENKKSSLKILNNYENKNTYFSFLQKTIKTKVDEVGLDICILKSISQI